MPAIVAGRIAGRVAPATAGRTVVVERSAGRTWSAQYERALTRAGGRYGAAIAEPGTYRVRYRGEAGPAVRVRHSV